MSATNVSNVTTAVVVTTSILIIVIIRICGDCECACDQSAANQMTAKEMEVCSICGAFLVVGDVPQRVEEHASGKLHMGYAKVRDTIENLKVVSAVTF